MFNAATRSRLQWVTAIVLATAAPCLANDPIPIAPSGQELFVDYDKDAKAFENVSGATCFEDATCILVADEMIAVQRIELDLDGREPTFEAGRTYGLIFEDHCQDISREDDCDEVDLEAIARDGRDILISGSMGNASRSGKKEKERWFLARFTVGKKGKAKKSKVIVQSDRGVLKRLFSGHAVLDPYVEEPLQCGGLNIEGMALLNGDIFFGLRSPADIGTGEAFMVQSPSSVLKADKKSDVEETILHRLSFRNGDGEPMRNIGIRALEPLGGRLLIATGDAGVDAPDKDRRKKILKRCEDVPDGAELLNISSAMPIAPRIWIWDPGTRADPLPVTTLAGPYASEKLEGIAVLPASSADGKVDLLLTIDGQDNVLALALLRGLDVPD